ncbi:MAG TPA: GNAT family N-acetyltransferase [Anaerolineaceae bacterium]|nr:GNAT family N-acetyltransferase [Anaerolineaceae bacterium]HPN50994.1 GNAT family N-acetyltransferase [Anaerolineaceae bacterium]
MPFILRRARPEDRQSIYDVEKSATPGLIYLPFVFDEFLADETGAFIVAETEDQLVGCGKFTLLPDGSAWLETLRVMKAFQGQGIGRLFYQRFFELGREKSVPAMRMYTNINNHASKGLAEQFGFAVAGTCLGQKMACQAGLVSSAPAGFVPVRDVEMAASLLFSLREKWPGFMVLNRTFYAFNQALANFLVERGMLYHDADGKNLVVLGARFMPQQALHIGLMDGDYTACLAFAMHLAAVKGVGSLQCLSPVGAKEAQAEMTRQGFQFEASEFIVMGVDLA